MNNITFIDNKQLIEEIYKYDVIIVGTGIHNSLGNGFQHDIKINFPNVEQAVKKTPYADIRKLGTVTVINGTPIFCVCFIHKGGYRKDITPDYLDYNSLRESLFLIDKNFENKKIATTLIGASQFDGNGDRNKIIEIFNCLSDKNQYFIYDYVQRDYREVNNEIWNKITSLVKKISHNELRMLKDQYIEQRKNGIYNNFVRKQNLNDVIDSYFEKLKKT